MFNYDRQIEELVKYFKNGEKKDQEFGIGIEIEHFVIYKDSLKTVSYYGEDGVETTLKDLRKKGWQGDLEDGHLLLLKKDDMVTTLEPGSQLEFSTSPKTSLKEIECSYFKFLEDLLPILDSKNQALINIGYHPVTEIDEITILPKKRYDFMFNYFKKRGSHAHNMMKGTASLQIAVDYRSEEDYIKKFLVANALTPVVYAMFDNGFYFEGKPYNHRNLRAYIWENTDKDRSGIVPSSFDKDFGYAKYSKYILDNPPILMDYGDRVVSTGDKKVRDLIDPDNYTKQELEHALTMFFPDVRTKNFIEIRMMDSVPYPLIMSVVAFWKGIIYNQDNLDFLYNKFKDLTYEDMVDARNEIYKKGLRGSLDGELVLDVAKEVTAIAKEGLPEEERYYLRPLEELLEKGKSPYDLVKELDKTEGKNEAVHWLVTDKVPFKCKKDSKKDS